MTQASERILAEINRLVCDVLKDESVQLKPETAANDVANWDSLNHIEIVVAVEKHFGIRFNFAELQKFRNVGEMAENISSKISGRVG